MSCLRRRRTMRTATIRRRRQAAIIADKIAENRTVCFLRRSATKSKMAEQEERIQLIAKQAIQSDLSY